MKLGFNTSGNNQTSQRTTAAVSIGKLRNSPGSTSRKFKYCNARSPDLNFTFNCVFNIPNNVQTPLDIEGGNIQTIVSVNGYIYLSQDYGRTWKIINQLSSLGYSLYGNAISLNGVYQTTCDTISTGKIFISNNSGNSWNNQTTGLPSNFYFLASQICMSGSGQYQYVVDEYSVSNNKIYVSSDFGTTWAEPLIPPDDFGNPLSISSISCSTTGQYCLTIGISQLAPGNNGILYFNSDYGETWGNNQAYTDSNIVCAAISGNGALVTIGYSNPTKGNVIIKTSSFNITSFQTGNVTNGPNGDWGIYAISLSYTGQYQIACNAAASGSGSGSNGYIYITTNYGVDWHYISNISGVPTVNMQWNNVAISPSGRTMVAVGYNGDFNVQNGTNWYVYSNDYGFTWNSTNFGSGDVITSIAIN